jgi:Uma2 family endonuclease
MSSATAEKNIGETSNKPTKGLPKHITWESFKNRYLSREDGYTYEWLNGQVEKTKRSMDYTQLFIVKNLVKFFNDLSSEGKIEGYLTPEVDTFFKENHRRPDMCYLTDKQMSETKFGVIPVPAFIIEVISNNDKMKKAQKKLLDYLNADVQVIWHVFPDIEMVHVYRGKNMTVCVGDDICSAAPVLPDFKLSTKDIFK